jgi:DNA topoisomerase-1
MESDLDVISSGEKEATPWLKTFYFGSANEDVEVEEGGVDAVDQVGLKGKIAKGFEDIDARGVCSVVIGTVSSGETIAARVGRYGGYIQIGDTDKRASIPDEQVLDELTVQEAQRLLDLSARANRALGEDPTTGQPVYLKSGRYGAYIQLGDPELTKSGNIKKGSKPKMVSLWPDKEPESLTLEDAMVMLSFPRVVGKHPDHDVEITIQDGRFGPYISMEVEGKKESRRLEGHAQLVTLTLDEALALFKEKPARGRRQSQGPLAVLAESPVTGKPIEIRTGRFGPYVTDGQVNATIPTVRDPLTITFDDALELIAMREERMRGQGKEPRPAAAGAKATTKTTKKKTTKKKTTKKKTTKKKASKKKTTKKKASKKKAAKAAPDA